MQLYLSVLYVYSAMASLVLGAAIYETLVVHPAWSRKPPESMAAFVGDPVGRLNIPAFWAPVAPLYALTALGALVLSYMKSAQSTSLLVSSLCAVAGVVWTLTYFRPNIERMLMQSGVGSSVDQQQRDARRWTQLNYLRTALVITAWIGVIMTLVTHA